MVNGLGDRARRVPSRRDFRRRTAACATFRRCETSGGASNRKRKRKPNENFAREVMELFTLGDAH
jgi:uncharacterized protein (DUF1800 family)